MEIWDDKHFVARLMGRPRNDTSLGTLVVILWRSGPVAGYLRAFVKRR